MAIKLCSDLSHIYRFWQLVLAAAGVLGVVIGGCFCPNVGRSVPCAVTNSLFDPLVLVKCSFCNSVG